MTYKLRSTPRMSTLTTAKAILLAVQLTARSDLTSLQTLLSLHQHQIPLETILRILLTHLPETLDPAEYVPLLEHLINGPDSRPEQISVQLDTSSLEDVSDEQAKHSVRKLGLLKLAPPNLPSDASNDPVVIFLYHRALRIDEVTGLIAFIPRLLEPFLSRAPYLRSWLITSVLPLIRLNYDYHDGEDTTISIPKFGLLDANDAVKLLLSRTSKAPGEHTASLVGRDIRGMIGPWMYGRRKEDQTHASEILEMQSKTSSTIDLYTGWEETFAWILEQASTSWATAVHAIDEWDGPSEADTGGYADFQDGMNDNDQQALEIRYARAILATAYSILDTSVAALNGVGQVLGRFVTLLDQERLPTLEQAAALLQPIPNSVNDLLRPENAGFLRNDPMNESNVLTKPSNESVQLAHALATSALIFVKAGIEINVRAVGELVFLQSKTEQAAELAKFIARASNQQRQDEKTWLRARNEIVWLHNWGSEELQKPEIPLAYGRGPLGQLETEDLEKAILQAVLSNSRKQVRLFNSHTLTCPQSLDLPKPYTILLAAHHFQLEYCRKLSYNHLCVPTKTRQMPTRPEVVSKRR